MANADRSINFKSSIPFEEVLLKATFQIDKDKSSVLRACVLVGIPLLLAHPELVDTLGHPKADVSNIVSLLR
jgi:hypothetical protein